MESQLLQQVYKIRGAESRTMLTPEQAKEFWDRKTQGIFTSLSDFSLTSLPAPTMVAWIDRNNIQIGGQ